MEELDWSVGQSYRKLMQKGMADHTLFLFSSDNGPWYEGNPGLHRGRKGLSLDGGQVVPCIAVYLEHKQEELKRPPGAGKIYKSRSIWVESESRTGSVLFPILVRSDMECFPEAELEMALAGEAEVAADITDALVRVGQQGLCFFQLAPVDKIV